jgi:hypothetical protein
LHQFYTTNTDEKTANKIAALIQIVDALAAQWKEVHWGFEWMSAYEDAVKQVQTLLASLNFPPLAKPTFVLDAELGERPSIEEREAGVFPLFTSHMLYSGC